MSPDTSFLNKKQHIITSAMGYIFISLVVIWQLVLAPRWACRDIKVRDPELLIILQVQEQYFKFSTYAVFVELNEY